MSYTGLVPDRGRRLMRERRGRHGNGEVRVETLWINSDNGLRRLLPQILDRGDEIKVHEGDKFRVSES